MKDNPVKVGVVGLGPVGMILAVKLKEAGCDVGLCDVNEARMRRIKTDGIRLTNVINAEARFDKLFGSIEELAAMEPEYVVFALKSYHVPAALASASILNTPDVNVVIAQNGIDVEEMYIPVFGEGKILRFVVNYAGGVTDPNTVKVTFFTPPNFIGSINDTRAPQAKKLVDILNSVNLTTEFLDSFELLKKSWQKTILNSALSALCGVGRLTMAEATSDPDTAELIEQTIEEALLVADKEKIRFSDDFVRLAIRYLKKGGDHFPSLALDLINGRQTEIDFFNGKIVEYGRKHYVRTPLNLAFTNMVKAMSNKNIISRIPGTGGEVTKKILGKGLTQPNDTPANYRNTKCYLGVDLGSAFTKFSVITQEGQVIFLYALPAMGNDRQAFNNVMQTIATNFPIASSCATGYGRKHYSGTDIIKTEINCAALAVSHLHPGAKNIIDVGGEDIKIIRCNDDNAVENFYMNDKCAAGTGSFIVEIAERADINVADMSSMASLSSYDRELNSFCTVFAKTEIMNWIFDGMKTEDIARGIYISIANRIAKMRLDPGIPTYMIGGVIAHHPYLRTILAEKFDKEFVISEFPQYVVATGAALAARNSAARPLENHESELKGVK